MSVKIAVIGQRGDGKSSFINNMLGRDIPDVSFAEDVEEIVEEYSSELDEGVKFYEIPAITGFEWTRENFFEKAVFAKNNYDYVFFVIKDRLTYNDYYVLQELQIKGFPFSILMTHVDILLDKARKRANGNNFEEDTILEQIKQATKGKMHARGIEPDTVEVHLVDNCTPSDFDFQTAIQHMLNMLPGEKAKLIQRALNSALPIEEHTIEYVEVEKWQDAQVDIAVVGENGCGKTTFARTLLGETFPDLPSSSSEGPLVYECAKNNKIKLHKVENSQMIDLLTQPNENTTTFDYAFLLTKHSKLSDNDSRVLEMLRSKEISTVVLRTHADVLVQNEEKESKKKKVIERNEKDIKKSFEKRGLDKSKLPVHFIDSKSPSEFGFKDAMDNLLSTVEERKRVSLTKTLTIFENCYSWCEIRIDIVLAGTSAHGKSSLINAIVGSEVATVGHIGNTTKKVTGYSVPGYPNIKLYDVPGMSSDFCPRDQFETKAELKDNNYDLFFIVIRDLLTTDAKFISDKVSKEGKQFSIVRTHVDETVKKYSSPKEPLQESEKRACADIRCKLEEQLTNLGMDPSETQIYLVNNQNTSKFDFPQLMEDMERNLPKLKRQAFLLCVTSFDPEMIEKKYNELLLVIFGFALGSAAGGLIPIPGVNMPADVILFVVATVRILSALGLSKNKIAAQEKLRRFKKGFLENQLVEFLKDHNFEALIAIRNSRHFKEGLKAASSGATKIAIAIVPILGRILGVVSVDEIMKATGVLVVVGMVVGSVTSFGVTLYLLHRELKNSKSCALFVSNLIQSNQTTNDNSGGLSMEQP